MQFFNQENITNINDFPIAPQNIQIAPWWGARPTLRNTVLE